MKLAIAQINTTVGDLMGNIARILDSAEKVREADLIVFPEMTVPGYPPRDMLYDASFVEAVQAATLDLAHQAKGLPPLLVGSFKPSGEKYYQHPSLHNVAYLMKDGEMQVAQVKQLLPIYDVFYEPRWFVPGKKTLPPIEIAGKKIGVMICEDMWDEEYNFHPGADLRAMGAEMLMVMSASPYRKGVGEGRLSHAKRQGLPLVFVNLVGATDELIFDGGSFRLGGEELKRFEEDVKVIDLNTTPIALGQADAKVTKGLRDEEELFNALVLGVRDFAGKNGLKNAFIGLSGGIDSSVTAVIAAEALGAENVTGIAIPSRFTDARSTESARELAEALGIKFEQVPLEKMHAAAEQVLGAERSGGVSGENIQARLRMVILMSYVNSAGGFLINTSNKTELTLGYATLYGDMAGAISPLGDLTKVEVMGLGKWINREWEMGERMKDEGGARVESGKTKESGGVIPKFVMERKPSAELKENQVDPFDYDVVSPTMEKMVLADESNAMMRASEHKRWGMGVVLKVSERAFGRGRMVPITRK